MYSEIDEKWVINTSDQSFSNACSRTEVLTCSNTTSTTSTFTSATVRSINDPFIGLSYIETQLENPHQARFVPPAVQFSYFPKQDNQKDAGCLYSSEQTLKKSTPQSFESSPVISSSSRTAESYSNNPSKNEKSSKIDILHCGNVAHTTPTMTATTLKNIDCPFTGLYLNEPPLNYQHQAGFVPPSIPFSYCPIEDSHRFDGRMYSSYQTFDSSQQFSKSPVTTRSSESGQNSLQILPKYLSKDKKSSRIDDLTYGIDLDSGITTHTSPTKTSILLENNESSREHQHPARHLPFSCLSKQSCQKIEHYKYSSDQILHPLQQSFESPDTSWSFTNGEIDDKNHLGNEKVSTVDFLIRDNTSLNTSTLTSTTLKNVEEPCMNSSSIYPPPFEHEHQARFVPPAVPLFYPSKQEDNLSKYGRMDPSDHSLDSFCPPAKLVTTSKSSKKSKSRSKRSLKDDKIRRG